MALDVLDDVLIHDLTLEAFERAFEAFTLINMYFRQQNTSFSNPDRRFSVAAFDQALPVQREVDPGQSLSLC